MTAAAILFIWHYARNIPYMDDFALVPVMTGHEPASLQWIWSQHNEHRPAISRLILVGLHRFIANDFRVGMYFNAGLLSAAAASTLVLVRRLRGSFSITDIVLPLSILNLGQTETLLISFAMNLVLTAWISCELIASGGHCRPSAWLATGSEIRSVLGAAATLRRQWPGYAPSARNVACWLLRLWLVVRARSRRSSAGHQLVATDGLLGGGRLVPD